MGQNLVPLVNIKIAGKWMFIPLKMVLIGIDPYPNPLIHHFLHSSSIHRPFPAHGEKFIPFGHHGSVGFSAVVTSPGILGELVI